MAFATNLSRFELLTDDARDPFEKKKKAAKTTGTKTQKKAPGKGSGQTQGQSAGKKKKNNNSNANATANNVPPPRQEEEYPELGSKASEPKPEVWSNVPTRTNNNNSSQGHPKEKRTKDQWSEWSKRDEEFVTDTYETDLEAALLQSKLEFHDQQNKVQTAKTKKSKKKGVTVSLPSFNDMLSSGKSDSFDAIASDPQHSSNGFGDGPVFTGDDDDPRMAQFRMESQMEIQRERQIALERKLINSRSPVLTVPSQKVKQSRDPAQLAFGELISEKDNIIAQISSEKAELEKEVDLLKNRFKKICSVFGEAQLKDKATLVNELEKVTKLNQDQNETIQELHSLLEQEKSKYSAAQSEIRKLNEQSRRRNPHSESAAQ